jgi:hypothetical protein
MLNMKLFDYIANVLSENSLQSIAKYLLKSDDEAYYADSHVDVPPQGLGPYAACCAGLELLRKWHQDVSSIELSGLFASTPMLVVEQEWLDELPNPPPPHVLIILAKNISGLPPDGLVAKTSSKANCPLAELLSGEFEDIEVLKFEASEECERLGGWVFRFDKTKNEPTSQPKK